MPRVTKARHSGRGEKANFRSLEHFQAKWTPVRVKKLRSNKDLETFSDSMGSENALGEASPAHWTNMFRALHGGRLLWGGTACSAGRKDFYPIRRCAML